MPFVKGQSGNPGGRPKREWTWSEELEKAANELETQTGKPFRELIAKRVVIEATKGNVLAAKELFNRMDGMPTQKQEHSGPNGEGLVFNLVTYGVHDPVQLPTNALHGADTSGPASLPSVELAQESEKDDTSGKPTDQTRV